MSYGLLCLSYSAWQYAKQGYKSRIAPIINARWAFAVLERAVFRIVVFLSSCLVLGGCAAKGEVQTSKAPEPKLDRASWHASQGGKLREAVHGTGYSLKQVEEGWLISIGEQGTFHPQRPEMLLPSALGSIGQLTRHLAADPEVAVMVVGLANGNYKLKSSEQVSHERAGSVASIFRLNKVPGHKLRLHGISNAPELDKKLGLALLVVPEQELHARASHYQTSAVAMIGNSRD